VFEPPEGAGCEELIDLLGDLLADAVQLGGLLARREGV
jgi:hypothetical protein